MGPGGPDRQIAEEIAKSCGATVSRLGLRFDRVATGLLERLKLFAETATPADATIVLTLTAPIRTPAKTTRALEQEIEALLQAGPGRADRIAEIGGNAVRLRLVGHASGRTHRFIGCVHNPDIDAVHLLDLVEQWLRA